VPIQIPDLVQAVAQAISPQAHTAASLLTPLADVEEGVVPTFILTGDAALDSMLGGGVRVGAITEITGER
jgi:RecA/RadA recombinase